MKRTLWFPIAALALTLAVSGCSKKPPVPMAAPPPGPMPGAFGPSPAESGGPVRPPNPPPIPLDSGITSAPLDSWDSKSIDAINSAADAPLKPVYFLYDSDELSEEAKEVLAANAEVLKTYDTWVDHH